MQNHSYLWDKVGNLVQRLDGNSPGPTENFYYDNLYRLDYSQRNGATNLDLSYDPSGNILTSTGSDVPVAAAGTISWYSYNLPSAITQGSASSQFFYGPNRARYKQVASGKTTLYLGGLMERVDTGGTIEYRHYVQAPTGLVAVHNRTPAAQSTHYTLRDHLGSVASITSASGTVLAMLSNGAYGKRRDGTWTGDPSAPEWSAIASATDRGFTGHEHLDGVSLIHMNGRVYDPVIGQFASPDPTIPDPLNTQSYNRYSYVNNNPLTFTDPSGFDPARSIEVEPDFEARRDALIYAYAQSVMFNGGHAPSIWDAPTGLDRARMQNPGFTGFGPLIAPSTSSGYWTRVPGGALRRKWKIPMDLSALLGILRAPGNT